MGACCLGAVGHSSLQEQIVLCLPAGGQGWGKARAKGGQPSLLAVGVSQEQVRGAQSAHSTCPLPGEGAFCPSFMSNLHPYTLSPSPFCPRHTVLACSDPHHPPPWSSLLSVANLLILGVMALALQPAGAPRKCCVNPGSQQLRKQVLEDAASHWSAMKQPGGMAAFCSK